MARPIYIKHLRIFAHDTPPKQNKFEFAQSFPLQSVLPQFELSSPTSLGLFYTPSKAQAINTYIVKAAASPEVYCYVITATETSPTVA